jgi:hypothetical protein
MCAAADVRVEMDETMLTGGGALPKLYASITIKLDQLYSSSPDANFFMPEKPAAPKKPFWVQSPLPGL